MLEKLKHVLTQEDTVLFVGSGISLWSGLPTWSRLIDDLCKYVEHSGASSALVKAEAARGDLLQAASYGFAKLTKSQIGAFMREECMYGTAKPHEIHRKIVTLGPRCFITTNYDNLLEEGLRTWQPARTHRPAVTNKQLTEIAEVVHARAVDFVFKPHGDAGDADSVVLTREQYRQLLPGGERSAALDAVKLLMATRPVVYVGFGLRDPDFLYLRDLLSNTYKGAIRDHYAIMSDVQADEFDYWRSSYGIHLISYATEVALDGTRNHRPLLNLLDQLAIHGKDPAPNESIDLSTNPATILALARHAARLTSFKQKERELPIHVQANSRQITQETLGIRQRSFSHWRIERFLDIGPDKAVLTGLPGAGKTYSLQRAAAKLAEKLHRYYFQERPTGGPPPVPIVVDLKLYTGDLFDLAAKTLPESIALEEMLKHFSFKFFVDSFNEMPREYWENGAYQADFTRFIQRIGGNSLIIGSRTTDGLQVFDLPTFDLAEISYEYVEAELARVDSHIAGTFRDEIISLLQKPFYFNLVIEGSLQLPPAPRPKDFYQAFFDQLLANFRARFNSPAPLIQILSLIAYDAVNRGEEALSLSIATSVLTVELGDTPIASTTATDIINWLVSKTVLIPYSGARIAFFHQSATEYLASLKLAELYVKDARVTKDKLRLNRWDQALFLTLSALSGSASQAFLQAVVDTDYELALRAAKYVESGRDDIVSQLLNKLIDLQNSDSECGHEVSHLIETSLPVSEVHEDPLRLLMKNGDSIGGAAAVRLFEIKGEKIKDELMQEFLRHADDFNYCHNGIASAIGPSLNIENAKTLYEIISTVAEDVTDENAENDYLGLISGVATALAEIPCEAVKAIFAPTGISKETPRVIIKILLHYLWDNCSSGSLALAADLLLQEVEEATVSIYFIGSQASREKISLNWNPFTTEHIDYLIFIVSDRGEHSWPIHALKFICAGRPDLGEYLSRATDGSNSMIKGIFEYCRDASKLEPIFRSLRQYLHTDEINRRQFPIAVLDEIDIFWQGQEELLIQLLKLRNKELARVLLGHPHDIYERVENNLELGDINWWLDWMLSQHSVANSWEFQQSLASFLAMQTSDNIRGRLLAEFNKSSTKYRPILLNILGQLTDVSTDDMSEDAVYYLLNQLEKESEWAKSAELLGEAATERFVNERLLPLQQGASRMLTIALRDVLSRAGSRHGRRYVVGPR